MSEQSPRLFGMSADVAVFVGLIAAPTVGGSLGLALVFLPQMLITGVVIDLSRVISVASGGFVVGLILGIPASFTIGLAVHTLMFRRGWVRVWHYAIFGPMIAIAIPFVIALFSGTVAGVWPVALLFSPCGLVGGIVFWLIRRPDRDQVSASLIP